MNTALTLRPTLYEETLPGGGHTSFILKRGQRVVTVTINVEEKP